MLFTVENFQDTNAGYNSRMVGVGGGWSRLEEVGAGYQSRLPEGYLH